jgi:hypothetical protein
MTVQEYPILILPNIIKSALQTPEPPLPPKTIGEVLKDFFVYLIVSVLLITTGLALGAFFWVIGLILFVANIINISSYPSHRKRYLKAKEEYDNLRSLPWPLPTPPEHKYFVDRLYQALLQVQPPIDCKADIRKGITEDNFKKYLANFFNIPNNDNNYQITINSTTFYPDITLKAKIRDRTIYFDIEIDEPYTYDDGPNWKVKPIHFIGSDDYRNDRFSQAGWIIIRFAEQQIVNNPLECCSFIRQVIRHLKSGGVFELPNNFNPSVKRWSDQEALQMALSNHRASYLRNKEH